MAWRSKPQELRCGFRFKKASNIKTVINNKNKQQTSAAVCFSKSIQLLKQAGFDEPAAIELARNASPHEIEQQIRWLPNRNPHRNSCGLLRRAIEQQWPEPATADNTPAVSEAVRCRQKQQKIDDDADQRQAKQQQQRREKQLAVWRSLPQGNRTIQTCPNPNGFPGLPSVLQNTDFAGARPSETTVKWRLSIFRAGSIRIQGMRVVQCRSETNLHRQNEAG